MKKKKGEREEARIEGSSLRKNGSGPLAVPRLLHPETMVEKAAFLLGSDAWEEVVVGLTVTTGRCLREIMKTGVLSPYKRYSLLFSAELERLDEVVGPFELPTLVEADRVIAGWQRVRTARSCAQMSEEEVCERYRPLVRASARKQFAELVALERDADGYTPLLRHVYAAIATRYYCPQHVSAQWFEAHVLGFDGSEKDDRVCRQWCQACQRPCAPLMIGDEADTLERRLGLKLGVEGYELLDWVKDWELEGGKQTRRSEKETAWEDEQEEDREPKSLEGTHGPVSPQEGGKSDQREAIPLWKPEGPRGGRRRKKESTPSGQRWPLSVFAETKARFDQIAQQLGTETQPQATLLALLTIAQVRRSLMDQVLSELSEEIEEGERGRGKEEEGTDEETDHFLNFLMDTYERQGYAVQVYFYQRFLQMVEPLVGKQDLRNPVEFLRRVLFAAFEEEGEDDTVR
jgi:hypothetical protein